MSGDWGHGLFGCLDDITVCKRFGSLIFCCLTLRNRSFVLDRPVLHLWKGGRNSRRELCHARRNCPVQPLVLVLHGSNSRKN